MVRSTANTNVVYWHGKLLALKEDSPPYALDPVTLETLGIYDFGGQLPSLTFTAHPKFDPATREMICMGYEAKGDATLDICYYTFDSDERLTELTWLKSPICGMIHDFAVTKNYVGGQVKSMMPKCIADNVTQVIMPMIPQICDLDRMKAGGEHWQWDSTIPMYIGVLPRRGGKASDVKV